MYRIGICDDDKIFCSQLEDAVYEIFNNIAADVEVEAWYSGEGLRKALQNGRKLDLLFLDIEMMEMNGVEVGMFIRDGLEDLDTNIVYISAKQNYAMQLFKVQPLDFLVKPVSAEQLQDVISRSLRRRKPEELYFEYQKAGSFCRIAIKDILYFASMDKKVAIGKKDGQEVFYGKLKVIADQLPDNFIMVHQSYIVNQDGYVVKLELPELKEMVSLLRYSSNNLNQLTKRVHETGRVYDVDLEDLRKNQERLWDAARDILAALAKLN